MKKTFIRSRAVVFATLTVLSCPSLFAAAPDDLDREFGDIVLLQPAQPHQWLQVTSDSEYIYTSNELLLPDTGLLPAQNDGLFYESLGLNVTPPKIGQLSSLLFARQEFVRYTKNQQYDFDAQTAGLQLSHPVADWFSIYGGGSAERLYQISNHHTFFKDYDAQFGLWRQQKVCDNLAVFGGYQFDWRPSTPGQYTRSDNTPFAGVIANLLPNLTAKLQYLLSAREYGKVSRNDINQTADLTLTYTFNEYVALTAFTRYSHNDSNVAADSYDLFEGGGGLKLTVSF